MSPAAVLEAGQAEVGVGLEVEDGLVVAVAAVGSEVLVAVVSEAVDQAAAGKLNYEKNVKATTLHSGFCFIETKSFITAILKSLFISLG